MKRLLPIRIMMSGLLLSLICVTTHAQLSKNPDKFLGNITTRYNVDYGNEKYYTLWNQITCENESKWGSVEGNRGSFNWGCDNAFNYAKNHNFPFKFHALIWGAQYPNWLPNLSPSERYQAIIKWLDAIKKKYPKLELIDVVNYFDLSHYFLLLSPVLSCTQRSETHLVGSSGDYLEFYLK